MAYKSYTSSAFDGSNNCIANVATAWNDHAFDGSSVPGDFNLTLTLLNYTGNIGDNLTCNVSVSVEGNNIYIRGLENTFNNVYLQKQIPNKLLCFFAFLCVNFSLSANTVSVATGLINNSDFNDWKIQGAVLNQYVPIDGNGVVNNLDYNLWINNRSKAGEPTIRL